MQATKISAEAEVSHNDKTKSSTKAEEQKIPDTQKEQQQIENTQAGENKQAGGDTQSDFERTKGLEEKEEHDSKQPKSEDDNRKEILRRPSTSRAFKPATTLRLQKKKPVHSPLARSLSSHRLMIPSSAHNNDNDPSPPPRHLVATSLALPPSVSLSHSFSRTHRLTPSGSSPSLRDSTKNSNQPTTMGPSEFASFHRLKSASVREKRGPSLLLAHASSSPSSPSSSSSSSSYLGSGPSYASPSVPSACTSSRRISTAPTPNLAATTTTSALTTTISASASASAIDPSSSPRTWHRAPPFFYIQNIKNDQKYRVAMLPKCLSFFLACKQFLNVWINNDQYNLLCKQHFKKTTF